MDPNYRRAETRTLQLPDSRTLSFAVFGAGAETFTTTNPSPTHQTQRPPRPAAVLFYFHGFPSSHEEASIFHQAARRHGVQIIALDRPGHAGSSFQPNRRIVDWPVDVLAFADSFAISRFGVLGLSGGAPYVFACWKAIPRERLVAAGVCSGLFPPEFGYAGMLLQGRVMLTVAPWLTPLVAWGMEMSLGRVARDEARPERFEGIVLEDLKSRPEVDRDVFDRDLGGVRSAMLASVRDAVVPGGWGPAWDVKLAGSHWGFEIGEPEVGPGEMVWWHGREDVNVPVGLAERAAECVTGAEVRFMEGEGHVSLVVSKAEEVISTLGGMLRKTR
ncbi:Alpha/Beta hydrolase protein [Colletotrichum godetiae]|uniref:Alpha/Beta hydrolase protein n=1 Tax=Colletotrichum godetiae TaxID=1209918 RepID=A0AAJ0ANQ7_9PEZI|nr:Alpha/Beta hydrolase protein [Colletotrichum godetiae]KAK1676610.1 Alpha/Beta hydrolase protein [Colletotrichum godetiae]